MDWIEFVLIASIFLLIGLFTGGAVLEPYQSKEDRMLKNTCYEEIDKCRMDLEICENKLDKEVIQ